MGAYNVINRTSMQAGQPEDISVPLANFDAIAAVLNGGIDNSNIAAGAGIVPSKISPGSAGQVLSTNPAGAAAWLGGLQQIQDILLAATTATIDFTGIPSTYSHLLVLGQVRCDQAANQTLNVRFNNDAAANYDFEQVQAQGAAASGFEGIAQTSMALGDAPGTGAPAGSFGSFHFILPHYTNVVSMKGVEGNSSLKATNAAGGVVAKATCGWWRTTNVIVARITLLPGAGSFVAGSRATLYGLN